MAFLMETLRVKHVWLSTERALGLVILMAIIKFYTTTKAVFKPLQTLKREQERETETKERMRCLLVSNAFTLKTQKQRVLADKKLFGCCSRATQKSPFKEWNKHIPFLTQNKNCSRPSLLLWIILLTRLIKTTSHIHKRVSLPHPACQGSCKPTSHGFNFVFAGWGCEQCRHKQTPVERTWKLAAMLALLSTMHSFIAADTVAWCVSITDRVSTSGHAYLVMEQVRELVLFVSNCLLFGRQAAGLTQWQGLGTAQPDSLSSWDKHWWEM